MLRAHWVTFGVTVVPPEAIGAPCVPGPAEMVLVSFVISVLSHSSRHLHSAHASPTRRGLRSSRLCRINAASDAHHADEFLGHLGRDHRRHAVHVPRRVVLDQIATDDAHGQLGEGVQRGEELPREDEKGVQGRMSRAAPGGAARWWRAQRLAAIEAQGSVWHSIARSGKQMPTRCQPVGRSLRRRPPAV